MEIFRRRPLMLCLACFLTVSAIAFFIQGWCKLVFLAVAVAVVIVLVTALLLCKNKQQRVRLAVALMALLFSAVAAGESFLYFNLYANSANKYEGNNCYIKASVLEEKASNSYDSRYILKIDSVNGEPLPIKAVLDCSFLVRLDTGDVISFNADCVQVDEVSYNQSAKLSYIADGITTAFLSEDSYTFGLEMSDEKLNTPIIAAEALNYSFSERLTDGIGGEEGKLASAVLLGNRDSLSDETIRDFSRSGISHLLALSGMHMAILTGIFEFILKKAGVSKLIRSIIMPAIMVGYLIITGFTLPALRAVIMLTAVYLSFIAAIPSDTSTTLFFAGALIVALMPSSVAAVEFWMSFLSTMGLVLVSPYLKKLFESKKQRGRLKRTAAKFWRWVCVSLIITITANISIVALSWLCFGEISIVAPLTNLFAAPATMILMELSILYILFGSVPYIGELFGAATRETGSFMLDFTGKVSEWRGITVSLNYVFAGIIIVLLLAAVIIMLIVKLKRKIYFLIPPTVAIVAFIICLTTTGILGSDSSAMTYLRRGEREIVLFTQNGKAVMCDMTDGSYANYSSAWKTAEKAENVTELEALMLTHYHDRHRYSVEKLFSCERVRSLWLPEPENQEDYIVFSELCRIAREHNVVCTVFGEDTGLKIFGGELIVLPAGYIERSVQPTTAFIYKYGEAVAAYIGSSYSEATLENDITSGADMVIYGTHGPNPKLGFSIDSSAGASEIVFADDVLFQLAYYNERSPENAHLICGSEYRKFILE